MFVACMTQFSQVGLIIFNCFYEGPMCRPVITYNKGSAKKKKEQLIIATCYKAMVTWCVKGESVIFIEIN